MNLAHVLTYLPPEATQIAVVEDETGAIVGCWAAFQVWHAEGVWIHPAYRGKLGPALRLWRRIRAIVLASGAHSVITGAQTPDIHALLQRKRATPIPVQEYVLCLR